MTQHDEAMVERAIYAGRMRAIMALPEECWGVLNKMPGEAEQAISAIVRAAIEALGVASPSPPETREGVIRLAQCDDCSSDGQPCPRCLAAAIRARGQS